MSPESRRGGTGPLRVVLLAAEMTPLAKAGGLADAVEGIAGGLAERGHSVEVILPGYGFLLDGSSGAVGPPSAAATWGPEDRRQTLRPIDSSGRRFRISLVEDAAFTGRRGIYLDPATGAEYPHAGVAWGAFARGSLELLAARGEPVDVVHLHDFHPALAPSFARRLGAGGSAAAAFVFTVHNAGYQGITPLTDLVRLGVPAADVAGGPWEFWGQANYLKAATVDADAVTTVSPRYAREIAESPEFGAGLEGVFRHRPGGIEGILNGIDVATWNPAADPHLVAPYSLSAPEGKRRNKEALLAETGLDPDPQRPLAGMVTRLVDQKGIDLVIEAGDRLVDAGLSLVVLGSGDPRYEAALDAWAASRPARVFHENAFNDPLAHRIQAGSDLFLMPSRYEPCGLTQLIALRYGTVPVVRRVGGLADTVRPLPPDGGEGGTGFLFSAYRADALVEAVVRALEAYRDPGRWRGLVRRGMAEDFSWGPPAARYEEVYRRALGTRSPAQDVV